MRWPIALLLAAAPLVAQEPTRELDVWLERWQGGQKLGWERRTIEQAPDGWRCVREAWSPIEGGEVRERTLTRADPRGLIAEQQIVRTGPGGEWTASLAAVGTGTTWTVRARQLAPVSGAVPGRVFDPHLLAWRIASGKQERPGANQVARLFDPVGLEVVATKIEVADAPDQVQEARVAVRLGQAIWWFGKGGALLRHELADGPGLELVAVADGTAAADMSRTRDWPAVPGLTARGLRHDGMGLHLTRPGPGWELLYAPKTDGGHQLGARHPDEVTLVVDEVPLAPPEDETARLRVGRALTTLVEAEGKGPFRLTHPRPTRWDDGRPALEFALTGQAGGADLRGKAWAVGGSRGGLLLIAFVPADQATRLAARLDAARKVVALDPASTAASPWKRVELAGLPASVEVPEEWRPASEEDPSLVAPGALVRFSAAKLPSEEGVARDMAIELVVRKTREQLGAKVLVDEPEASLGGRKGRRVVLEGFTSTREGGLATRVEYGIVPEADGGFTLLMGVALESPGAAPILERVMGSLRWKPGK